MESNRRDGVLLPDPRDLAERRAVAATCAARLGLSVPVLVDGMENRVGRAYNGWPERLYVVGTDGRVAYMGEKGPYGFHPEELRAFLEKTLE